MSTEELQQINKPLIDKVTTAVVGGAVGIIITVILGAMSVRDAVLRHEVRISALEKITDRHEALLTQKNK